MNEGILLTRVGRDGWITVGIMELTSESTVRGRVATYFESVLAFALLIKEVTKVHLYYIN